MRRKREQKRLKLWTRILSCLAILVLLAAPAFAASNFFSAVEVSEASGVLAKKNSAPMVERSRLVRLNLDLLQAPDASSSALSSSSQVAVTFNVFPEVDIAVNALPEQGRNTLGSRIWLGRVEGEPLSSVTFAVTNGVAAGMIRTQQGRVYEIEYVQGDVYVVKQIDMNAYPPEKAPVRVPSDSAGSADAPKSDAGAPKPEGAAADSGFLIDVLVVYTQAVASAAGGSDSIASKIALAETEANQGYANSNLAQRIRVVHSAQVDYDETPGFDQALEDLKGTSDGKMDEAHTLRDQYGADMVSLFIVNADSCGLAYMFDSSYLSPSKDFAPLAFSVVALDCATGYYSFAHEMGHNQGCDHDRANGTAGAYSYSFGYQHPNATPAQSWRTIMAYSCTVSCTRLNYWSNPTILHQGEPMGVETSSASSAYNALSMNNTRVIAANWRQTVVPLPASRVPAYGEIGLAAFVLLMLAAPLLRRFLRSRKRT